MSENLREIPWKYAKCDDQKKKKKVKQCRLHKDLELLNQRNGDVIRKWPWEVNVLPTLNPDSEVREKELSLEGIEQGV